ncbi:DinB family protein [Galbibacter sp. EGI 63066]|uniref:DinB family protein n=1 Tax=Galbibacter sp. EGI 63066 TaxID=2993559 RepID=UPI00224920E4|nr:DinB family protein [Galbibacter sp. EGI 63066]MCX2680805.1 DinB family protein [Galbibacter sp. EGI 63066]
MNISAVKHTEYHDFYRGYIEVLGEVELLDEMIRRKKAMLTLLEGVNKFQFGFSYAEGKWSIKELLLHMIDAERVFQYRALCIARGDKTNFPGFEQDHYVQHSKAGERSKKSLIDEFSIVRDSSVALFTSFPAEVVQETGVVSGHPMSVRAIGFIISGHQKHHEKVIKEKYLKV